MKIIVLASLLLCISTLCFSKDNIFVEGKDKLPINAQNFINKSFVGERLVYVKESRTLFFQKKFLAVFSNGLKIEFDSRGNWIEITSKNVGLPRTILSIKIRRYLESYHISFLILEIERKRNDVLRVLLSNKNELYFDRFGDRLLLEF